MTEQARRPRLWSLPNKLALLFFATIAVAFTVLYVAVVPALESNLRKQTQEDIARVADGFRTYLERLSRDPNVSAATFDSQVRSIADAADARLTVVGVQQSLRRGGEAFYVITDSREQRGVPENPALARAALRAGGVASGTRLFRGTELGQVAQPLRYRGRFHRVAIYSRSLGQVAETVSFVRDRLLIAGGAALLVAMLGGYGVAQALARRVRRLEEAAAEVAAGRHVEPLPVDSRDELGQLTHAFNEMQEKLRQVDRARKEFVATASHELRTPIFSLGGFVELLRNEDLDEEMRGEFLDTMAEQVERLQKLAVDLLDLSRLDAGSVALDVEELDLAEVARAVANEFMPAIRDRSVTLDLLLPDSGVGATCDRERTAQIIRILLDNALRHTPERANVRVTATGDGVAATLTIADDGPGLPTDIPVFDRFVTGDAARGAGLGLAIGRELAERMRGSLRALDATSGAAFELQLPGAL
jgi:two-component system, OmpR family, sensor kinase